MRAAVYARVSTPEQRLEPQLDPLRTFVAARNWEIVEFSDHGFSGAKDKRPGLDGLMRAARSRKIDAVVVAAFDRFARLTRHLLTALEEFRVLGVQFVSLREQMDTSTPLGKMVFTVVAAVAELERALIGERVRAGMAAARLRGQHVGRPFCSVDVGRARQMISAGTSITRTAQALGVSPATLSRYLRAQDAHRAVAAAVAEGSENERPKTVSFRASEIGISSVQKE